MKRAGVCISIYQVEMAVLEYERYCYGWVFNSASKQLHKGCTRSCFHRASGI